MEKATYSEVRKATRLWVAMIVRENGSFAADILSAFGDRKFNPHTARAADMCRRALRELDMELRK